MPRGIVAEYISSHRRVDTLVAGIIGGRGQWKSPSAMGIKNPTPTIETEQ